MKKYSFIILSVLFVGSLSAADGVWNVMDKSMDKWNADGKNGSVDKAWSFYKGKELNDTENTRTQMTEENGFVRVIKNGVGGGSHSMLINSWDMNLPEKTAYTVEIEARLNPLDKETYPDAEGVGYESALLSMRLNNKVADFYLRYGDNPGETDPNRKGYVYIAPTLTPNEEDLYYLDVSQWHKYRIVISADNTIFDVYVDGELAFESLPTAGMNGTDIVRIGANLRHRCNVDVRHVRVGEGDFNSVSRISTVSVGSDSHIAGTARTVAVQAYTVLMPEGQKVQLSLVGEDGKEAMTPVEYEVKNNRVDADFTIPATLPEGKYALQVSVPGGKIGDVEVKPKSFEYVITGESPIGLFPKVNPVGFVREIEDYQYIGLKKEFIFPSIIDTKPHLNADGKFQDGTTPIDRYYLFYTPHENPGGMFLSTAPTLDGPWTEYGGKPSSSTTNGCVMTFDWAKAQNPVIGQGGSHEKHVSACQVIWNDGIGKYVMYFHGPNPRSHYATSDDLLNWTYGEQIFHSSQFAAGAVEASYAKAFEYTVPGLDNKYVMLLMTQQGSIRRIYWAHSKDGLKWTPVRKALVSPDLDYKKVPGTDHKPSYEGSFGNNVAGPSLWIKDGRYLVLCHGSAGNMMVVEVGEKFDREIHWGEYLRKEDVLIDRDENGALSPVLRVSSAQFIQADDGEWYMFFEAGSRLHANIAWAKESAPKPGTGVEEVISENFSVCLSRNVLCAGESISVASLTDETLLSEIRLYNLNGQLADCVALQDRASVLQAPAVSGMYILRVLLGDDTTQEFKILVK